jgi:hypothetical protein
VAPATRRRLAALAPSARLAAGYSPARAPRVRYAGVARQPRARYAGVARPRPGRYAGVGVPARSYGLADGAPYGAGYGSSYGFGGAQRSGRWVRRGRKIILLGI